jgi:hypothetical protein
LGIFRFADHPEIGRMQNTTAFLDSDPVSG